MAKKHYSNLNNDLWGKVAPLLDKYAKFYWDDEPMTNYHAFIINEKKGSLKFYNGPSFSNSYTKPQFESASTRFTGVTFNTQQISFTIAVYAVTEEQYRKLIYKLHPYTIGNLVFDFDTDWRYIVKLAKREDSTRTYIGKNSDNQDLFYTELKLTFEVQGDAVAHSIAELDYHVDPSTIDDGIQTIEFYAKKDGEIKWSTSDLDTPFLLTFDVNGWEEFVSGSYDIECNLVDTSNSYNNNQHTITLFKVSLQNLTTNYLYKFEYNSQTGDLCLIHDNKREIITLLTTYGSGKRIVKSLSTTKISLPGSFNGGDLSKIKIVLNTTNCKADLSSESGNGINCYARTVLI